MELSLCAQFVHPLCIYVCGQFLLYVCRYVFGSFVICCRQFFLYVFSLCRPLVRSFFIFLVRNVFYVLAPLFRLFRSLIALIDGFVSQFVRSLCRVYAVICLCISLCIYFVMCVFRSVCRSLGSYLFGYVVRQLCMQAVISLFRYFVRTVFMQLFRQVVRQLFLYVFRSFFIYFVMCYVVRCSFVLYGVIGISSVCIYQLCMQFFMCVCISVFRYFYISQFFLPIFIQLYSCLFRSCVRVCLNLIYVVVYQFVFIHLFISLVVCVFRDFFMLGFCMSVYMYLCIAFLYLCIYWFRSLCMSFVISCVCRSLRICAVRSFYMYLVFSLCRQSFRYFFLSAVLSLVICLVLGVFIQLCLVARHIFLSFVSYVFIQLFSQFGRCLVRYVCRSVFSQFVRSLFL